MIGVTVLDVINIYDLSWWQILITILPLIVGGVLCLASLYKAYKVSSEEERASNFITWSPKNFLYVFIGAVLSFIVLGVLENTCPAKYIETQYEIKIEDSVYFNELYNKYEILEEKDTTFIVKLRGEK